MATTHYAELKLFAQSTSGVINASVEFNVTTLSPTYKLTIGLPGRSNAFAIAKRLGLPQAVIEGARQLISDEDVEADRILERIRHSRHEMGRATSAAQIALSQAREQEKEARRLLREAEVQRQQLLSEAQAQWEEAEEELRHIREAAERQQVTQQWLEEAAQRVRKAQEKQKKTQPSPVVTPKSGLLHEPLSVGDTVWIASLNQLGQVLTLHGVEAEVQVGSFRAKLPALQLEKRPSPAAPVGETSVHVAMAPRPLPGMELHLRGMRAEAAIDELTKYLDDAYLAGMPFVRIVHGKGTGTLRKVVQEILQSHPLVASFNVADLKEGGEGVTVVRLVASQVS